MSPFRPTEARDRGRSWRERVPWTQPPVIVLRSSILLPYADATIVLDVYGWGWFWGGGKRGFVSGERTFEFTFSSPREMVFQATNVFGTSTFRYVPRAFGASAPRSPLYDEIPRAALPRSDDPGHPGAPLVRMRPGFWWSPAAVLAPFHHALSGMRSDVAAPILPTSLGRPPQAMWSELSDTPSHPDRSPGDPS